MGVQIFANECLSKTLLPSKISFRHFPFMKYGTIWIFLPLDFMDFQANKDIRQVTPINHFGFQF
jgi:hypothetical protein